MNEQTNTNLVQQAYQSVGTGDVASLLNLLAEDVFWQLPEMPNVPFAGIWRGRQQVGQFFSRMAETQDILEFQPEEFIAQGNTVVALGKFTMHIKATGKHARSAWAHVWTFEAGKVIAMREHVDSLAVNQAHTV